jgi:hypothetical protein
LATTILARIALMQISTIKRPKVMRENKISGPIINNKVGKGPIVCNL